MLLYLVIVLIITAILCLLRSEWEKKNPKAEFYSFGKGEKSIRFVLVADAHGEFHDGKTVDIIRNQKPDMVLLGGDLITCWKYKDLKSGTDEAISFLKQLRNICPVVYSEGNHESRFERRFPDAYNDYVSEIESLDIAYLKNEKLELKPQGIDIYGLSMDKIYFDHNRPQIHAKHEYMDEDYISGKLGKPDKDRFNILFMHTPLYAKMAAKWGADLVLSAHFHGGTVWLGKYLGGLMTPQYGFFVRECQGVFRTRKDKLDFSGNTDNRLMNKDDSETYLLVNRGLGTHSIKIRFMDRPEISVIDVKYDK